MVNDLRQLAISAASRAAEVLRDDFLYLKKINDNSGKDIKTKADLRAEEILISTLEPSGYPILSEESGATTTNCLDNTCWIIDPLDGTQNYVRGFPINAVSIALWDKGKPQLGVIHDIPGDSCYFGQVGIGVWFNNTPIRVSLISDIKQAVLATGFPSGRSYSTEDLLEFIKSVQLYKKIRMIGSASLSLAQVAAGCFDIYIEEEIWLWDVAAGLALVEAAGGKVYFSPPKPDWKVNVIAWNGKFDPETI